MRGRRALALPLINRTRATPLQRSYPAIRQRVMIFPNALATREISLVTISRERLTGDFVSPKRQLACSSKPTPRALSRDANVEAGTPIR